MKSRKKLLSAAIAALTMTGCPDPPAPQQPQASQPTADTDKGKVVPAVEKHACKGLNACKGQGGCKSGDGSCAGKNSSKGKGGCEVPVKAEHLKKAS